MSVLEFKKKEKKEEKKEDTKENEASFSFEDIMKKNKEKKEKEEKERLSKNKGVLRSYRIKT